MHPFAAVKHDGGARDGLACVALWPAQPCGWRGQCVGGTCQCDEGWALSGLDTQGADQCIKYRPITGAPHVTWAAVVPPLALLYASNVLLDWRVRRGSVGSGDRVAAALFGVSLVMHFICALLPSRSPHADQVELNAQDCECVIESVMFVRPVAVVVGWTNPSFAC